MSLRSATARPCARRARPRRRPRSGELATSVVGYGLRVTIGYGHFVSDDGRDMLGTSFFMQLDDRAAVDKFLADEPLNKAGLYQRIEIHRWSNSFQKRQAYYRRKGLCFVSSLSNNPP
jgi:hypothetical protein